MSQYSAANVRRSAVHFLAGRGMSAILTFALLAVLARLSPMSEYATYVALLAVYEIVGALSTFGLDWVVMRYLPEFQIHATRQQYRRFLVSTLSLRLLALFLTTSILAFLLPLIAAWFNLPPDPALIKLLMLLVVVEFFGRFLRDVVLGSLLKQGIAQLAGLLRIAAQLALVVGFYYWQQQLNAGLLIWAELAASTMMLLVLLGYCHNLSVPEREANLNWQPPVASVMAKMAWHNFFGLLCNLCYGPHAIMLLANRLLAPEMVALFAFARNLADQIRRYLPMELLMGIIRPTLTATYAADQDFSKLNERVGFIYKMSVIALSPMFVMIGVAGAAVVGLVGGHQYVGAAWMCLLLLLNLLPYSHRRMLEFLANLLGCSGLWAKASLLSIIVLPLAWLLGQTLGVVGFAIAMILGEMLTNFYMIRGLHSRGFAYAAPLRPTIIMLTSVGFIIAAAKLAAFPDQGVWGWLIGGVAVVVCFVFLYVFRAITKADAALLIDFINAKKRKN